MTNYTDIPTGEEQGLISENTITKKMTKRDENFYLKLACVALLCVVAFMSGTGVRARNTAASMVNTALRNCQVVSTIRADGFGGDGFDPPGVEECIEQGGLYDANCLDPNEADMAIIYLNHLLPEESPNGWQKKSCNEQGFWSFTREYVPDYMPGILNQRFGFGNYFEKYRRVCC